MFKKSLHFVLIFAVITSWIFSGWPQIYNFPPKVLVVQAATITAYATSNSADGALTGWTNLTYTYTDDGTQFATRAGTNKNEWYGTLYGFDLSAIPDGSIINSVTVTAEWKNSANDTSGPVLYLGANSGGSEVGTGTSDTSGTTSFEIVTKIPTGLTTANLKATGASGFWAILRFRRTDNTAHTASVDYVKVVVDYTAVSAPTVTTQAATDKESTTATCNGTITATGGANATARGCEWDTDSGTPYVNSASDSGDFGAVSFTKALTGLPAGTTIYARAFGTNSAGTGYGSEVNFLTKPAAPTNVVATDNLSDKVTITWTKSTGATDYHVWRDSTDLGSAGDVATFDDTGADAPTITAGTSVASDGTNPAQVSLSLSGTSANDGTTYVYKVVASNATGNSIDSATDNGYRSVGALTYQWQKSAGDSDASYSDISGATTASYDDTEAPADGSGRYYKAVLNATGATQQTSVANRGYRQLISISLTTDGSVNFGYVPKNTTEDSTVGGINDVEVVRVDSGPADLDIKSSIFSEGGNTWTLGASNGDNIVKWEFSKDGSSWTTFANADPVSYVLDTNVSQSSTRSVYFKITIPTVTNSYQQYGATVTIVASAP